MEGKQKPQQRTQNPALPQRRAFVNPLADKRQEAAPAASLAHPPIKHTLRPSAVFARNHCRDNRHAPFSKQRVSMCFQLLHGVFLLCYAALAPYNTR